MAPAGAVSKPFAAEELNNASLLCERGDLLIKHHERLREAEGCFKKVSARAALLACARPVLLTRGWRGPARPSPSHGGFRTTNARRTCASPATSALPTSVRDLHVRALSLDSRVPACCSLGARAPRAARLFRTALPRHPRSSQRAILDALWRA